MSSEQAQLLRCVDARRIYDYLQEHGPCSPGEIGEALPDLDRNRRGQIVSRLREFGLVEKVRTGNRYLWKVVE